MVAHSVAAIHRFSVRALFGCLGMCCFKSCVHSVGQTLSTASAISLRFEFGSVTVEFLRSHNILVDIVRKSGSLWITTSAVRRKRRSRERKQKRGCRAGALAMEAATQTTASQPFSDERQIKMDELRLQVATNNSMKDSCILLITEIWFHPFILDSAIKLKACQQFMSAATGGLMQ